MRMWRRQLLTTAAIGGLLVAVRPTEAQAQVGPILEWIKQIFEGLKVARDAIETLVDLKNWLNSKPSICSVSVQDLVMLGVSCRAIAAALKSGERQGAIPTLEVYVSNPGSENWEHARDQLSFFLEAIDRLLIEVKQCLEGLDPDAFPKEREDLEQLNRALRLIRPTIVGIESADEHSDLRNPDFVKNILVLLYPLPDSAGRAVVSARRALEERQKRVCS